MNIINRFRPAKQFRCLPLVGKEAPFGYVKRLTTQAEENNYQAAGPMVEAFALMNEKGREEWLKLTGGSKIDEASQSMSSDGSHRLDALYTFAKGTIMSASALLSNSSVNLQS